MAGFFLDGVWNALVHKTQSVAKLLFHYRALIPGFYFVENVGLFFDVMYFIQEQAGDDTFGKVPYLLVLASREFFINFNVTHQG